MRAVGLPSWAYRSLLLAVNVAGILWIHHDLAGSGLPGLRVLAALPSRDVDQTDRFTLVFDRPLSLPGMPGEACLAANPFQIFPPVAGQWFWAAPEKLEYRLDKPLPPGRQFNLRAAPTLEQMLGRKLLGPAEFQFKTRQLKLVSCLVTSADGEHANVELGFNQPVDPADLARHLKPTDAASTQPLELQILNHAPDSVLTVRTARPRSDKLTVSLGAALAGAGAELPLGEQVSRVLEVESAFAVVDVHTSPASFNSESCVKIRFSKRLDADYVRESQTCVRVNPAVAGLRARVRHERLVLCGPFESGRSYTAWISAELPSDGGEKLGRDTTVSFQVSDRKPGMRLVNGGGILTPHGHLLVEMEHVNLPIVHLQAGRVHTNNLVSHLRGESRPATSREFPARTVQLEGPRNATATAAVDLRSLLGEPLGIYWIRACGPEGTWIRASTVVAVTDLAITAKQEREGYCVWVTSLSTARPIAGVEVAAVSYNNQVLVRASTDGSGIARLAVPPEHPDGPAWVITARLGDDMSYLKPQERPWVLDEVGQSGRKSPTTYDVMLYAERGVYRPGETIHLTGIIRDATGQVPPPFPLTVSVYRPDGKEIAQLPISSAAGGQGVFQIDYVSPDLGQTGPYRFRAGLPGSKDVLGSATALVEEYVPQRLELRVTSSPRFGPDQPVEVEAAARYLFDQPAAGLPVQVNGIYRRETFRSARFAEFDFSPPDPNADEAIPEDETTLDENGHALVTVPSPSLSSPGLWRADLNFTVSEQGGRSVSRRIETRVDSAGRYVGLRLPADRVVPVGVPVEVDWLQLTADDKPAVPGPASYTLMRVDRDTTLQRVDGRYVWRTVEQTTQIRHAELPAPVEPIGRFEMVCPGAGLYRLAVTDCTSGCTVQIEFRATADVDQAMVSAAGRPDRVALTLDRACYSPGSTARLAVQAPFAGTMLLTVETDRVIDSRVFELAETAGEFELPVDAGLRGGAFITATLIRAIRPDEQTWLPHRAMGMIRLPTDHTGHDLELAIEAPAQARPGEIVPIRVRTAPPIDERNPAVVHLWAVDEGILLATDYETPSPAGHFFAPRQAEVISADVFGDLMPDHQRPAGMARIGGDYDDSYRRRLSPVALPRNAPAVLWRAAVAVGPDGTVTAELPMPELTGRLRLMAVAVDHDRYGSAARPLVLATPLLVEMSCPRFAAPDDVIELPLKIFNCTDAELTVTADLSAGGPLRLEGASPSPLQVEPNRPVVVWARAVATGLGSVSLVARVEAKTRDGEMLSSRQRTVFAVRPAGPLHSESQIVAVQVGAPYRIDPQDKWLADTAETTVCLGPRPTVHLQPAVEELIDYPYGCVEQTTSRLYVLLHAPDLLNLEPGSTSRADAIGGMIKAGLSRLWSMQTRAGGLGYWPGDPRPCTWGTVYAAEFIIMAERQGYSPAPAFTSELAKYLESLVQDEGHESVDENLRAHLCYVLARMQRPQRAWMTRLNETKEDLDVAGRAYLAGAWIELGRKDQASSLLSGDVLSQTVSVTHSARPTSQVHQDSVLLNVLMDLDAEHPWIPVLAARLEKARTNGRWGSTLENAAALAALARYQLAGTEPASFEGLVRQGEFVRPFDHAAVQTFTLRADQPIEITSSGQGRIHLSLTTEGLLVKAPPREYDRNLVVSRRWSDRSGQPIDPGRVRVGDLILVEVSLASPNVLPYNTLDNIAVVDALPAGLELENPRLASSEQDGDGHADEAGHVEFRDDRIVIFSSAGRKERVFRYALRAITAGSFVVPPVQASCMYDSSIASVHGGGRVLIAR